MIEHLNTSRTSKRGSESKILMRADQTRGRSDEIRIVPCLLAIWQQREVL